MIAEDLGSCNRRLEGAHPKGSMVRAGWTSLLDVGSVLALTWRKKDSAEWTVRYVEELESQLEEVGINGRMAR